MFRRIEQVEFGVASTIQMHLVTAHDERYAFYVYTF